ncbi:MAG: hypothetical protein B6226_02945 [Candidatus Cloacimonetes bacterium 4572_65]|nr:MAG: hypothetical protein B6226_02945 [Candidatus Cloacimonetes bacterium 4572_65]
MKNSIDIQKMSDTRNVTIDKVGVKGVKYPIIVDDRSNGIQHTIADLDIYVELPHQHRGTHMSRFIELLNKYHTKNFISEIENFVEDIVRDITVKLREDSRIQRFYVESENFESIHNHSAYASVYESRES